MKNAIQNEENNERKWVIYSPKSAGRKSKNFSDIFDNSKSSIIIDSVVFKSP